MEESDKILEGLADFLLEKGFEIVAILAVTDRNTVLSTTKGSENGVSGNHILNLGASMISSGAHTIQTALQGDDRATEISLHALSEGLTNMNSNVINSKFKRIDESLQEKEN